MSISKIRENARAALNGKWGKGALITLAYLAFFFIIGFVTGLFEEDSVIGSLLELATSIIQVPVLFGLGYAFMKLKRDEEVKAFDFLNLGFSNFGRAWKISLREALKLILPFILLVISIGILVYGANGADSAVLLGDSTNFDAGLMILGLVLYVASLIWFAVRSLLYSLTTYIAYDKPDMSSLDVVNESARMMRGNRGKIFLLSLSFIGWAILTVFTLGIGYLLLLPYMKVAEVCFYEYLIGKNENNNSEGNEDVVTEM